MATFVYTWNPTFLGTPADTEVESLGAQRIRDTKSAVGERFVIDHDLSGTGNDGKHQWVTLEPISQTPPFTLDTGNGRLFSSAATGNTELYYQDSSNTITQLTSNGAINLVPKFPGEVFAFAGPTPPTNSLFCNGGSYPTTTYPQLFAIIGYGYGGSGGNFNVPDLRARVIAGWDESNASGRLTSAFNGTLDANNLGNAGGDQLAQQHIHDNVLNFTDVEHSHTFPTQTNGGGGADGTPDSDAGAAGPNGSTNSAFTGLNPSLTNASEFSGESQNVQPTFILNYFIYAGAAA